MLVTNDPQTPGTPQMFCQASSENSFQDTLNLPAGLLKLRIATTAMGTKR